MRMFERNVDVDRQLAALDDALPSAQKVDALVGLAWYLRQRDNTRARQFVQEARALLAEQPESDEVQTCNARLLLIDAETWWLESQSAQAERTAIVALAIFASVGSHSGCADCHGLLMSIRSGAGEIEQRDTDLANAIAYAVAAQDTERLVFFEATQARYTALRDFRQNTAQWGPQYAGDLSQLHPSQSAGIHNYFGVCDFHSGNFAGALARWNLAFEAACDSGQLINAVVVAVNCGGTYITLNDYDAALEWLQRALDLARPNGWAATLGPCLSQMGEVMRAMGRMDAAQQLLDEAIVVYAPMRNSRNYAMVLVALGDLAQARGDYPRSLALFQQHVVRAEELMQIDVAIDGHIGIASALAQLGRTLEAQETATVALQMAQEQGAVLQKVKALRLLARIHGTRGENDHALARLEQVLQLAGTVDGYFMPSDVLSALAAAYAAVERFKDAYDMALQASDAREKVFNQEASHRATAIQVRLGTERSRIESEQHRRQAEGETRRAALLEQTSDTLEKLGTIGQEITSQLDKEHLFAAIERHIHGLLDASSFAIYLMDTDGRAMTSVYDVEDGIRLPSDHIDLDDPQAFSARCARERRELMIDFSDAAIARRYVPGTMQTISALFAPLMIADRVLGVMTIQSTKPKAYADNDLLIFRTLCAYTAIALDNAVAYSHLRDAKDQLVAHEKLAALGSLVAGVAHELNTPIGNSLLTASTLQENTVALAEAAQDGTLRRSTLTHFIASNQEGLGLVVRGLRSASDLVQSFKQVAVDRATEQRRPFGLLRTSQEVVATLQRSILLAGHRLEVDIAADIELDGYPGPFGQVLTNLIHNALLHAFANRHGGTMRLSAERLRSGQVEISFSDDGEGISAENLPRIFDPFFTTKLGQGGSGLGMSICYNIVTALFGGEFEVRSTLGQGSCFVLRLPLVAPQHQVSDPFIHPVA